MVLYWFSLSRTHTHKAGIVKLLWSRHNPVIYAALLDGSVQLWDSRTAQCLKEWRGHHDALLDLSLNEYVIILHVALVYICLSLIIIIIYIIVAAGREVVY